jgi:hypothetical protein
MTFTIGEYYSRREIHEALGGELETYLPQRDGQIVCACLTEELGSDVPNKVLIGDAPKVIEKANLLLTQSEPIPVFLKVAKNHWQYVGEYRVDGSSTSSVVIEQEEEASGRNGIVMVLYLRRAEDASQHHLLYWRGSTADHNVGNLLDHIASDQLKPGFINLGDTIWIVTSHDGQLFLLGRMIVGKIIEGQREAEREWGKGPLWKAKFHIKPEPGTEEFARKVEITDLASFLRFESKDADRLTVDKGRVNAQQLQRVRKLTVESARLLETRLGSSSYDNDDELGQLSGVGAGFGDAAKNKEVEQAAVACVRCLYEAEGWYVESVEAKKIGYDLLCRRGMAEEHVEVKGVQGEIASFIITEGEYRRAKEDPDFVLYVLTRALTKQAQLKRFAAKSLLYDFAFIPISYRAVFKGEE